MPIFYYPRTCLNVTKYLTVLYLSTLGQNAEACMEDGDVESLAQSLPSDLTEFVLQNNNEFREECIRWDKEQEERKRLEETQQELSQQQSAGNSNMSSAAIDPNNDRDVLVRMGFT